MSNEGKSKSRREVLYTKILWERSIPTSSWTLIVGESMKTSFLSIIFILSTASWAGGRGLDSGNPGGSDLIPPTNNDRPNTGIVNFDQIRRQNEGITPLSNLSGSLLKEREKVSYDSFYTEFLQNMKNFFNQEALAFYQVSALRQKLENFDDPGLSDEEKRQKNMTIMFLLGTLDRERGYQKVYSASLIPRTRAEFMQLFYQFSPSSEGRNTDPLSELNFLGGTGNLASSCLPYGFSTFEGYRLKSFIGSAKYNFEANNIESINLSSSLGCLSRFYGTHSTRDNPLMMKDLFISYTGWSKRDFENGLNFLLNDRDLMGGVWGLAYFSQVKDPLISSRIDKMRLLKTMQENSPSQYALFAQVWREQNGEAALLEAPLHDDNSVLHGRVNDNRLTLAAIVSNLRNTHGESSVQVVLDEIGVNVDENGIVTCQSSGSFGGPLAQGGSTINELCYRAP